ncbi:hypothetical protein Bbelb_084360 [Branchiostoma belcheri]|nr:hypothetical protein Bbelb_084360 [Branchiostoma belcheri]
MAAITDTRSFVRAVQDLFGVERLREHQQSMLRALLDGRDVFLSVRTGGGKSLCYMGFPAAAKALAKAETELGQAPRHLIAAPCPIFENCGMQALDARQETVSRCSQQQQTNACALYNFGDSSEIDNRT